MDWRVFCVSYTLVIVIVIQNRLLHTERKSVTVLKIYTVRLAYSRYDAMHLDCKVSTINLTRLRIMCEYVASPVVWNLEPDERDKATDLG